MTEPRDLPTDVSFVFARDDYVVLSRVLARRPLGRVLLGLSIYVAFAGYAVFAYGADLSATPSWVIFVLVIGPPLTVFHTTFVGGIARLLYRRNAAAGQPMTLSFHDDVLEIALPLTRSRIAWSGFRGLVETPHHLILVISHREGIAIPRRTLPTAAAYDALRTFLSARIAAA